MSVEEGDQASNGFSAELFGCARFVSVLVFYFTMLSAYNLI